MKFEYEVKAVFADTSSLKYTFATRWGVSKAVRTALKANNVLNVVVTKCRKVVFNQ